MVVVFRILRVFVWVLYALAIIAIVALAFGFVLAMFGANTTVPFAQLVYDLTSRFMDPFKELIKPTKLSGTAFISWSALIAIAAYAVIAWVLSMIADWFTLRIDRARGAEFRQEQAEVATAAQAPVAADDAARAAMGYTPPAGQPVAPVVPAAAAAAGAAAVQPAAGPPAVAPGQQPAPAPAPAQPTVPVADTVAQPPAAPPAQPAVPVADTVTQPPAAAPQPPAQPPVPPAQPPQQPGA